MQHLMTMNLNRNGMGVLDMGSFIYADKTSIYFVFEDWRRRRNKRGVHLGYNILVSAHALHRCQGWKYHTYTHALLMPSSFVGLSTVQHWANDNKNKAVMDLFILSFSLFSTAWLPTGLVRSLSRIDCRRSSCRRRRRGCG